MKVGKCKRRDIEYEISAIEIDRLHCAHLANFVLKSPTQFVKYMVNSNVRNKVGT